MHTWERLHAAHVGAFARRYVGEFNMPLATWEWLPRYAAVPTADTLATVTMTHLRVDISTRLTQLTHDTTPKMDSSPGFRKTPTVPRAHTSPLQVVRTHKASHTLPIFRRRVTHGGYHSRRSMLCVIECIAKHTNSAVEIWNKVLGRTHALSSARTSRFKEEGQPRFWREGDPGKTSKCLGDEPGDRGE